MKLAVAIFIITALSIGAVAQSAVENIVAAEKSFARYASENGTKKAFLNFAASDGLLFLPDKVNAREYWSARSESKGALVWAPNFADASANGMLGYVTGNWEFRPEGKTLAPTGYGQFVTIWLRQPDGEYRFVIDIGVGHEKPASFSEQWSSPQEKADDLYEKNLSAGDAANAFFEVLTRDGLAKAYERFAVEDVRGYREGQMPLLGRKALTGYIKKEKAVYKLAKRSSFFGSADLAYSTNTYAKSADGKVVEKGNTVQIWKLIEGKWRLVLDVFKPVK